MVRERERETSNIDVSRTALLTALFPDANQNRLVCVVENLGLIVTDIAGGIESVNLARFLMYVD